MMTRGEAIKAFEEIKVNAQNNLGAKWAHGCDGYYRYKIELTDAALRALRPVSREQVEKMYPGCPMCENGLPKIHIPAFQALAICNQHMNHEAFDIELNSKFCLNCGRPMTDEAVEMVMERLEADCEPKTI